MKPVLLLLRKDLVVLRRSPALALVLAAYPLVIAALIGLAAAYATAKPKVAFVDQDGLPRTFRAGERVFCVQCVIDGVKGDVELVRMDDEGAAAALAAGRVVASLTVPYGFTGALQSLSQSPALVLRTGRGGLAPRVEQQMQALVYRLNRLLQGAYIDSVLEYVDLIRQGGRGGFLGRTFDIIGLKGTGVLLRRLPPSPERARVLHFVDQSQFALTLTGTALRLAANPIRLEQPRATGRTWLLSAQVQAYGLALTITFLALLLAAGATAAERDENVAGRLRRGLVSGWQLVAAKVALAATVALALGTALALVFGVVVEARGVPGGEPWARVPLVALGLALTGAAVGALGVALGVLARESRTASLVAVLVVLPLVFLGLVPPQVVPPAGWISDAFPFAHAVRFLSSALYDPSPWGTVGRELAWIAGLAAIFAAAARAGARRLSA